MRRLRQLDDESMLRCCWRLPAAAVVNPFSSKNPVTCEGALNLMSPARTYLFSCSSAIFTYFFLPLHPADFARKEKVDLSGLSAEAIEAALAQAVVKGNSAPRALHQSVEPFQQQAVVE